MRVFADLDELTAAKGEHLGTGGWIELTQERIDTFADATGAKTPTIALSGGTAASFSCTAIDPTTFVSVCDAAVGTSQTGVTSAAVTVPTI